MQEKFRAIPSVDKCVQALTRIDSSLENAPKVLLTSLINAFWIQKREQIKMGECKESVALDNQLQSLLEFVRKGIVPRFKQIINGTGVIIHTNLGRSVLPEAARKALMQAADGYSNLEFNLETGERGSRQEIVQKLLCLLTGAEDGLVVNNNAAAVLLILDTLCAGGETIVSRGELVEIGGSFRIPDIMQKSGTVLKEVGTTNRTRLDDYRNAINDQTKAILRAHTSNFKIIGFHSAVSLKELKNLAAGYHLPLIFDLGSGNLLDFSGQGLPDEPVIKDILSQGADLVCFSGDKALGGPQAGIIAGKTNLITRLKRNPLYRALRCDKLCLAALEATLRLYLNPEIAKKEIPTIKMMSLSENELRKKASHLARSLRNAFRKANIGCGIELNKGSSQVGGGSFPESSLPTTLVRLYPENISAQALRQNLLEADLPLLGRIEKNAFCLDPRTLQQSEYPAVVNSLVEALRS